MRFARSIFTLLLLAASASAMAQTLPCPDSTSLTRTIGNEVTVAHAGWRANVQGPVPEACLYTAVAKVPFAHSDSVILKALELSTEALRRSPENPEILAARMVLLSRARRYTEIPPTMDALFTARPGATNEEMHRLTVAAVMQLRDTAAIINRLANAATRFPRSRTFVPEYQVWRQIPRLRALIDTVHRTMKKDPTLTVGLVNLSSIYGNLDRPDSAIAYAKRALKARVAKDAVGKALESLIGVRMRRAQILGVPEGWTATLPVAYAIDSTLSTPASKYLIALTLSQIVADEARLAQYISFGLDGYEIQGYGRPTTNASGQSSVRVMSCERLAELNAMIDRSRSTLTAGGETFAAETVPAIRRGLDAMERLIGQLKPRCTS